MAHTTTEKVSLSRKSIGNHQQLRPVSSRMFRTDVDSLILRTSSSAKVTHTHKPSCATTQASISARSTVAAPTASAAAIATAPRSITAAVVGCNRSRSRRIRPGGGIDNGLLISSIGQRVKHHLIRYLH